MKTIRDPHHGSVIEYKFENGKYYNRHVGTRNWVEIKKIHPTPARINTLACLNNVMTKRDILIFLSDVSNKEIAEYVTEQLELAGITEDPIIVTQDQAQKFKEWLAGKLADGDEVEVSIPFNSLIEPFEP